MNRSSVDQVVNAVLYEGYILYPYRASAQKNRQRFTFGRVYPQAYSSAQNGAEPCMMQTQCLVQKQTGTPRIEISVRFLHLMVREAGVLSAPLTEWPADAEPLSFQVVSELRVDGNPYQTWQEAVEREICIAPLALDEPVYHAEFSFPESETVEPLRDHQGRIPGVIRRRQCALAGTIEVATEPVDTHVSRTTVRIVNQTPVPDSIQEDGEAILMRTFASTHTILRAQDSEFLSMIDPPVSYAPTAADCKNIGAWPVLIGDEQKSERNTMLSSPIILYDYPQIARASPGDLFDSGEIDEMLTLRILTMTDDEKLEMRSVDEHARRILQRTEALPEDHLLKLHGTMHTPRSADEEFFNPITRLESVSANGVELRAGRRVRIRPKGHADAMDMVLAGRTAVIEAVEQDTEDRVYLALVLDEDPGKDFGLMRQPGHRFFYGVNEVEPLQDGE